MRAIRADKHLGGARTMRSIWRRGTQPAKFRTAWRGYDRSEVDEFLRRTDADRKRLQEEVSQLSALMSHSGTDRRELERLAAVRREVASCLETSIGALRTATGLLGGTTTPLPTVVPTAPVDRTPRPIPAEHLMASLRLREGRSPDPPVSRPPAPAPRLRGFLPTRLSIVRGQPAVVGGGVLAVLVFAGFMYQREPSATEIPDADSSSAERAAAQTLPPETASTLPDAALAVPAREDGLVLTLTALRASWVGTTLDGGQRMERLLATNETILLRATSEAILRVGDATAVSVLINNQPTRPLGSTGQVVTARITKDNYKKLLLN
jgi:DivIVA domain-containing protein